MDVNSLGQGRQNAFEFNYSTNDSSIDTENTMQDVSIQSGTVTNSIKIDQNDSQQKRITEKDVKSATDKLNKLLEGKSTHVEYDFIGKSRTMSVKIIDDKTQDVIKEIPPKKIIEMIDKLCELAGIMVDEKA